MNEQQREILSAQSKFEQEKARMTDLVGRLTSDSFAGLMVYLNHIRQDPAPALRRAVSALEGGDASTAQTWRLIAWLAQMALGEAADVLREQMESRR